MTKKESVAALNEILSEVLETEVSVKKTETIFDAWQEKLQEALQNREPVLMPGFKVELVDRAARTGVNPKTGEKISIPARKAPAIKIGPAGKKLYNN